MVLTGCLHHFIGIWETASSGNNPITQTLNLSQGCLDWCKGQRTDDDISKPSPKVQIVMEEAHLLIPEWNFNPTPTQRDQVNSISQIVLQARKYGLGFLIVSQRTANVTKSVLNQCNTIVAFQGFDDTGADFLANYMGAFFAQSLPNLRTRHAVIVGKASRSRRPLIARLNEDSRTLRDEPIADMPIPKLPEGLN